MAVIYKSFALRIVALSFSLMLGVAHGQESSIAINVATAYPESNFHTQNLLQYANDVSKATNGRVNFKIYPAGTLLKQTEIFQGVRSGKVEAGEVLMSSLVKESPLFAIDSLPFIVSSYDDAFRMWEASKAGIEKALSEKGMQLLYAVPWPPQNLYSKRVIAMPNDFKGLRMRTYNPATERISELIGAKPVTIQAVDLTSAIAGGKLDMMLTSSSTGVEAAAWSQLRYYYKVNAWIPKNVVFVSKKIFAGLTEENQKKILEAAHAAEFRGWGLSRSSNASYEAQLAENGVHVETIDPFLRRYLDRLGENLARDWLKQAGRDELMVLLKYTTDRSMKAR